MFLYRLCFLSGKDFLTLYFQANQLDDEKGIVEKISG